MNKKDEFEKEYNDDFLHRLELTSEHLHHQHEANKKKKEQKEQADLQYENQLKQFELSKELQEKATEEANLHLQHVLEGNEAQQEAAEQEDQLDQHFNPTPFRHSPKPTPDSGGRDHGDSNE